MAEKTMRMVARYEREKGLKVRREPNLAAGVVRTMAPGEECECHEVRGGWARLDDGYANAQYLTIVPGGAVGTHVGEAASGTLPGEGAGHVAAAPDETAELRKMTNLQLYDLAEQSGIPVRKGATKGELVAAILGDE